MIAQFRKQKGLIDDATDSIDDAPNIPAAGEMLWQWFLELCQGRRSNGFGPERFSWEDIRAWAELLRVTLTPYDILTLKSMDIAYCGELAKQSAAQQQRKTRK